MDLVNFLKMSYLQYYITVEQSFKKCILKSKEMMFSLLFLPYFTQLLHQEWLSNLDLIWLNRLYLVIKYSKLWNINQKFSLMKTKLK